jgi:hypothetical protein
MAGGVAMTFTPVGRAFARRLGGNKETSADLDDLRAEVAELRAELDDARTRLGGSVEELHGRLDFAERMLAQGKEKTALPGAR